MKARGEKGAGGMLETNACEGQGGATPGHARQRALGEAWRRRLGRLELVCPMCNGRFEYRGVDHRQLYQRGDGGNRAGQTGEADLVVCVCTNCGYVARFQVGDGGTG
jgi:hypothetical protein